MRILIADDNCSSRISVANFLRKLGYQVDEYEDGYSALTGFLANNYEMVLSDIKMPHMSGIELLRVIKASPNHNNVDVVLFTGYGDLDYAIQALRLGAYDYLLKPLNVKEIAEITERIAKRRENINITKELTPRECQVLELLAQGLTNKEIAEKLYLSPSTIRTNVSKILQKLSLPNRSAAAAFAVKHLEI